MGVLVKIGGKVKKKQKTKQIQTKTTPKKTKTLWYTMESRSTSRRRYYFSPIRKWSSHAFSPRRSFFPSIYTGKPKQLDLNSKYLNSYVAFLNNFIRFSHWHLVNSYLSKTWFLKRHCLETIHAVHVHGVVQNTNDSFLSKRLWPNVFILHQNHFLIKVYTFI